jgi:hypothetical protein
METPEPQELREPLEPVPEVPEEVPEVPEVPEVVEVPEVPKVVEEVVVPKRRGRPPGAKNKPKPAKVEVEKAAEAADYEPRQEDVALATRYFARHLGQMGQMSLEAKRARWRELFM